MELDKIITGDSAVVLQGFESDCIDLTVTSPPYFNAREYSQYENYQKYLDVLESIFTQVFRVTKPSRMVIVNLSPIIVERRKRSEQSYRIPIPFHFVPLMEKIGFEFLEDIIWKKPEGSAVKRNGGFFQHRKPVAYKPNLVTEYILVFKKPAPFLIDKVLKNEPVSDCEIEWTNVWSIQPETKSKHPAPFPEELAKKCISYYSYKGDTVLDCFCGSGTTPKMARLLNRHYIGIDTSVEYVALTNERLAQLERPNTASLDDSADPGENRGAADV